MSFEIKPETAVNLCEAKAILLDKFHTVSKQISSLTGDKYLPTVIRLKVKVDKVLIPDWLISQCADIKTYWSERDIYYEMAGIGVADSIKIKAPVDYKQVFDELSCRLIACDTEVRYYGGFEFSGNFYDKSKHKDSNWSDFGEGFFIMPRLELVSTEDGTQLILNIIPKKDKKRLQAIGSELESMITEVKSVNYTLPDLIERINLPGRAVWQKEVENVLGEIDKKTFEKVVLARKCSLTFSESLDPSAITKMLKENSPVCFQFCFQTKAGGAFAGATPEMLYGRQGRTIKCEALAGTRQRGNDVENDQNLSGALLNSDKERREQKFVGDYIYNIFERLCESVSSENEVRVLKLNHLQHLVSDFEGVLKKSVGDSDLLASLHPTPAVGGYPKEKALAYLAEHELFDRGWYAGPVGWISNSAAEFVVAIRSGLILKNRLELYSGAGIVKGSIPENEWKEIENKIKSFKDIIPAL